MPQFLRRMQREPESRDVNRELRNPRMMLDDHVPVLLNLVRLRLGVRNLADLLPHNIDLGTGRQQDPRHLQRETLKVPRVEFDETGQALHVPFDRQEIVPMRQCARCSYSHAFCLPRRAASAAAAHDSTSRRRLQAGVGLNPPSADR